MASTRVHKSIKNAYYSLIAQVLTVFLNFVARVKFVEILGIEVNGLNGLFMEVIAMLSLAELGVGTAITYSLYKPLAEKDEKKISQIMWLFRTAYLAIAAFILVSGLALTPFIHYIVKDTSLELSYIRRIFVLFILRTVSTYLMSYKTSLLSADQKAYVSSAINAVTKVICTISCIVVLITLKSFEAYLIVVIIFNLISNLCITIYSKKHYPYIKASDRLEKKECLEILSNIKHIFIAKLSGKITNSTDNILISVLVNTVSTGVYSNYSLVITNVKQIFEHIMSSITGSYGNLMATESAQRCERTMRNLNFLFFAFGVFLGGGLICASPSFIEFFFGEQCLLDEFTLFVCSFNLCISVWIFPLWQIMGVSGLFKYDKWISITGSTINLIVSYILGKYLGMAGIFIGTTCTYVVQMLLKIHLLYKRKFHMSSVKMFVRTLIMYAVSFAVIYVEHKICSIYSFDSLMLTFFVSGVTSAVISITIVSLLYCRSSELRYFVNLGLNRLKKSRSENK